MGVYQCINQDNMVHTCIYIVRKQTKSMTMHIVVYTYYRENRAGDPVQRRRWGPGWSAQCHFFSWPWSPTRWDARRCTPGLARAWRCGLDAMWMTGVLQSMGLPKMRDTISLFTSAVSGMGISNKSIKTSRTEARCLAKARSAGHCVRAQIHRG